MSEFSAQTTPRRSIWLRGLLMILMALAYQVVSTLLFCVALIQFVLAVVSETPNTRLMALGRNLGRYQSQVADFVSFARDEPPFPFSDWPSGG